MKAVETNFVRLSGTSITQICETWKEVNKDHEEIVTLKHFLLSFIICCNLLFKIAFFGTQVLAPTETNLEHDAKALTVR